MIAHNYTSKQGLRRAPKGWSYNYVGGEIDWSDAFANLNNLYRELKVNEYAPRAETQPELIVRQARHGHAQTMIAWTKRILSKL
ncbi:hypothetical protein LTR17_007217 [Elasticomyces elasticus]|nr:hypothetical protein LTR17_007217 [Elasticomyces elasticus]